MSNTLTTMSATLIGDEILPALKLGLSPLNAMSFETPDKELAVGDIVQVGVVSAKTATTYTSTFESGNSTTTGTSVTMLAPTFSAWFVNPNLEAAPTPERFLAQGKEAAYAVAKSVMQAVLGVFITSNISNTANTDKIVVTAANFDADDYADQIKMCRTKGVSGGISAILDLSYAAAMQKDNAIQNASAYGNAGVIQTGELPAVLGVPSYYTDAFPTALTNENTGVIFTGKTTCAVAVGAPAKLDPAGDREAGIREVMVTDPGSGLSMVWRTWVNSATGEYWGAVYASYGFSFIQDAATRVLSA